MAINKRVYEAVMSGKSDYNIRFASFTKLIVDLGFRLVAQEGSHRNYRHDALRVKISVQPDGDKAKAYQVKQLRDIIKKYKL